MVNQWCHFFTNLCLNCFISVLISYLGFNFRGFRQFLFFLSLNYVQISLWTKFDLLIKYHLNFHVGTVHPRSIVHFDLATLGIKTDRSSQAYRSVTEQAVFLNAIVISQYIGIYILSEKHFLFHVVILSEGCFTFAFTFGITKQGGKQ